MNIIIFIFCIIKWVIIINLSKKSVVMVGLVWINGRWRKKFYLKFSSLDKNNLWFIDYLEVR